MTFLQAVRFFVGEAFVGLGRSWRVSLLAVLTIGVSLFLAGVFLLTSSNLARSVAEWRAEARFVVYLSKPDLEARQALEQELRKSPWVLQVRYVTPEEGAKRFREAFPSLAALVDDSHYGSLPASIEARLAPISTVQRPAFGAWVRRLSGEPGVEMVDDDHDWIEDVEALIAVVEAIGTLLTAILLGAAVFTIAAVVRLTSFLYRDEIAVMRLVGATEFFIRGPFYFEGILQGTAGSLLAVGTLRLAHLAVRSRLTHSLVLEVVARDFLSLTQVGELVLFGAVAGLVGALVSLGREIPTSERS